MRVLMGLAESCLAYRFLGAPRHLFHRFVKHDWRRQLLDISILGIPVVGAPADFDHIELSEATLRQVDLYSPLARPFLGPEPGRWQRNISCDAVLSQPNVGNAKPLGNHGDRFRLDEAIQLLTRK